MEIENSDQMDAREWSNKKNTVEKYKLKSNKMCAEYPLNESSWRIELKCYDDYGCMNAPAVRV